MNYCAGYLRPQENQQLGLPVDLVRRFPRRLQELVGYSVYIGLIGHIGHIGHIDTGASGAAVLGGDASADLVWDLLRPQV